MDLDDVEAFLAVVEHRGFRRASDVLFVSQPTVTRRVQHLERDLRTQLLRRTPQGVELTPSGAAFVPRARRLLTVATEARSTIKGNQSESIILACPPTGVVGYLRDFLPDWHAAHPRTRIHVIEDGPQANLQHLLDHECDAAILAGSLDGRLTGLPVGKVTVGTVFPRSHRFHLEDGALNVRELDGESILVTSDEYRVNQMLRAAARAAAIHPEIIFQSTVAHALASLSRAGLGVAVVTDAVPINEPEMARRPLTGPDGSLLSYDVFVAWDRERVLSPVLETFVRDLSAFTTGRRASS